MSGMLQEKTEDRARNPFLPKKERGDWKKKVKCENEIPTVAGNGQDAPSPALSLAPLEELPRPWPARARSTGCRSRGVGACPRHVEFPLPVVAPGCTGTLSAPFPQHCPFSALSYTRGGILSEYFSLSWQLGTRRCSWMLPAALHAPTTFWRAKRSSTKRAGCGAGAQLAWQGTPGSIPWPLPWSPRRCWKPTGASRVKRNDREGKKQLKN